jgi:signal peptidase I
MQNTLLIGDHILVSKFAYGIHIPNVIPFLNIKLFDDIVLFQRTPKREDIIVFKYPKNENRDFIKRVIGVPGDLLEVRRQKVYINEELIKEKHALHTDIPQQSRLVPRDDFGPVVVPSGHLFTMGDNRENSQDSRFWGFLETKKIKGKALVIYWSWNAEDNWVRSDRFGQILR